MSECINIKLVTGFLSKNKSVFLITFFYWLITGLIPYLTLQVEFGERASKISNVYQDLFLFPLILGWLIPFFLYQSFQKTINGTFRASKWKYLLGLMLIAIIALVLDHNNDYTIWEIRKDFQDSAFINSNVLPSINQEKLVVVGLTEISLYDHFKDPDDTFEKFKMINGDDKQKREIGEAFKAKIVTYLSSWSNASVTRYTYFVSLLLQTYVFAMAFLVCGLIFRLVVTQDQESKRKLLYNVESLVLVLLVVLVWLIKLVANQYHKAVIFNGTTGLSASTFFNSVNIGIVILLVGFCIFIAGIFWFQFRKRIQAIIALITSVSIPTITVTVPKDVFISVISNPDLIWVFLAIILLISLVFISSPNEEIT